jgi:hypothetical protein
MHRYDTASGNTPVLLLPCPAKEVEPDLTPFDAAPRERPTSAPCPQAAQSNAITAIAVPVQVMVVKSADGRGGAQVSGRLAGFCASKHTCFMTAALILNLGFWGLTVSFILAVSDMLGLDGKFDNPVVNIMAFFMVTVYIIHWILIYISPIAAHLNAESIDGLDALEAHVQQLHQTPPRIVMSIVCSHSESSSSTDSDGNSTTISETVVTHRAEQQFQYDDVTDVSAPFVVPLQNDTVRLALTARSSFADAYTAQLFDAEYRVFISTNTRDVDVQHSYRCDVPRLVSTRLVTVRGEQSCALKPVWYYLAAIFCLDGLYGLFFANAASELDYEIVKVIRRRQRAAAQKRRAITTS